MERSHFLFFAILSVKWIELGSSVPPIFFRSVDFICPPPTVLSSFPSLSLSNSFSLSFSFCLSLFQSASLRSGRSPFHEIIELTQVRRGKASYDSHEKLEEAKPKIGWLFVTFAEALGNKDREKGKQKNKKKDEARKRLLVLWVGRWRRNAGKSPSGCLRGLPYYRESLSPAPHTTVQSRCSLNAMTI